MNEPSTTQAPLANSEEAPHLLTINQVVAALKISRWQLYQLINKQDLKTVRINRRRLVAPADLATFIQELREKGVSHGR